MIKLNIGMLNNEISHIMNENVVKTAFKLSY